MNEKSTDDIFEKFFGGKSSDKKPDNLTPQQEAGLEFMRIAKQYGKK